MKTVALFLANGFEEIEALGTVDILRRADINVITTSITTEKEVTGAHNMTVVADKTFSELDFSKVDVIVLPGGMPGAKHLNEHEDLKTKVKEFADKGNTVGAICAAPMVLGGLGILEGKKATCYPSFEEYLVGAEATSESVVVDANIITGKGPAFMFDFALQLVETIAGESKRKEVQAGLLL